MRYALVKDGLVVNVILLQDPNTTSTPEGCELIADPNSEARIGLGWTEEGFENPIVPVFTKAITRKQLRLVLLLELNITLEDIREKIKDPSLPLSPTEREVISIQLDDTQMFERDDHFVTQVGTFLNLTPEQINTLWEKATIL